MADLFTRKDGKWISREDIGIENAGSFEDAIGASVYRNGSWESIFDPKFLTKGSGADMESLDDWTNTVSEFVVVSNYPKFGNSCLYFENNIGRGHIASYKPYENPKEARRVSYWYREQSGPSHGSRYYVRDINGNVICGVRTNNPEYDVYDGNGWQNINGGPGYERWINVEIEFDWTNNTFDVTWTDSSTGNKVTAIDRPMASTNPVHEFELYGHGGQTQAWVDGVVIEDSDESVNAYTGLDASGNLIGSGGVYGGLDYKTEGLVLSLDATHPASYPGFGNTWYDLSGNDYHAKGDPNASGGGFDDSRFPTWEQENGGRFHFDGSRGLNIESDMPNLGNSGTFEFWFYADLGTDSDYFFDARNGTGNWWILNYNANIDAHHSLKYNDPAAADNAYVGDSNLHGRWVHVAITGNTNSQSQIAIDGEVIPETDDRYLSNNPVDFGLGSDFRIGCRYTSSGRWQGYFGQVRLYDHELTASEIKSHYDATKSRYI